MPLHIQLHIEHPSTAFPLTLEHLNARMNIKMNLERQRPLKHLMTNRALVASRFGRCTNRILWVPAERRTLAVRVLLLVVEARQR